MDADPSRPFKMNAKTAYYIKIILPHWFKHFCSFRVVNIDLMLLAVPVTHKSPLLRSSASPVQVQYPCGYSWREDQRSPMKCDLYGSSRLERRTASVSAGRDRYGCEILLRRIKSPFWRVPRWNQPVDLFLLAPEICTQATIFHNLRRILRLFCRSQRSSVKDQAWESSAASGGDRFSSSSV